MSAPPTPSSPYGSPSATSPFHSHPSMLSITRHIEPPPRPNRKSHVQFVEPPPDSLAHPPTGHLLVRSLSTGYDPSTRGHERNVLPSPRPTRPKSTGLAETSRWRVGKSSTQLSNYGRSQRSRSSSRRRRSSLVITPSSPPPLDQREMPDGPALQLIRTVPRFRRAVLELLATITTQNESPLHWIEPVTMETDHPMTSTQENPEMAISTPRIGDADEDSAVSSESPRSSSGTWHQQKCLLDVELQRLLTWERNLRDHVYDTTALADAEQSGDNLSTVQSKKIVKDAFSSIGHTLISALNEENVFKEKVDRVQTLFKEFHKVHTPPDSKSQRQGDTLETIKNAVDTLFGASKLLERSTTNSGGQMDIGLSRARSSRQLSASSHVASAKVRVTPNPSRRSQSPQGVVIGKRKEPQLRRVARTLFQDTGNDALGKDKGLDTERKTNTHMENSLQVRDSADLGSSSRLKTGHTSRDFEKKIVLKLADHPDAFVERRGGPDSTISSSLKRDVLRKVSQLDTRELSPNMLELSEQFSTLGLRLPSAAVVKKLRELSQNEALEDVANPSNSISSTSELLDTVNSILALFKSMPDWYVYTRVNQKRYAAAAVSFIRYSLLEQVTTCIADISFLLESRLTQSSDTGRVQSQFGALCDLIPMVDQLEKLIRDSKRDRDLQLYLRLIETRLMIATADIEHAEKSQADCLDSDVDILIDEPVLEDEAMLEIRSPPNPTTRAFAGAKQPPSAMDLLPEMEPSERYEDVLEGSTTGSRKYPLLALACYLETADEQSTVTEPDSRYIPSGLNLLRVKDLLYASDVNMADVV